MIYKSDRYSLHWSGDIKPFHKVQMQPLANRSYYDPLTLSMWRWGIGVVWRHDRRWVAFCREHCLTSTRYWHFSVNHLEDLKLCNHLIVFAQSLVVHVDGVRLYLWTAATNRPTVHTPGDIWVRGAMVEWYRQEKTKELEKPVPVPLCPPQIPHGPTQASAARCWWLPDPWYGLLSHLKQHYLLQKSFTTP
jgi:hypothetical protein